MTFPRGLISPITKWAATPNTSGGYDFAAPVKIMGRWEDKTELFRNMQGDEVSSRAVVFTDTDCVVEDYLAQGDQTGTVNPFNATGAYQVKRFDKIPDLRSSSNLRVAYMI